MPKRICYQKIHVPHEGLKENFPVFSVNCEHCGINFKSKSSQKTVGRSLKRHVLDKTDKIKTSKWYVFLASGQKVKPGFLGSKCLKCHYCNRMFTKTNSQKTFKKSS